MSTLVCTMTLCHICWREWLYSLTWKLALGEPTFQALVCPTCDDMWLAQKESA